MIFVKIDENGFFVEHEIFEYHPILTEEVVVTKTDYDGQVSIVSVTEVPTLDADSNPILDPLYIGIEVPQGFYLPRWTGTKWVEGGTELEAQPHEPTTDERLDSLEEVMLFML